MCWRWIDRRQALHRWKITELNALRALAAEGKTRRQAAEALGVTLQAVRSASRNYSVLFVRAPYARHDIPSLSMRGDGECVSDHEWDGTGWPRNEDFWP